MNTESTRDTSSGTWVSRFLKIDRGDKHSASSFRLPETGAHGTQEEGVDRTRASHARNSAFVAVERLLVEIEHAWFTAALAALVGSGALGRNGAGIVLGIVLGIGTGHRRDETAEKWVRFHFAPIGCAARRRLGFGGGRLCGRWHTSTQQSCAVADEPRGDGPPRGVCSRGASRATLLPLERIEVPSMNKTARLAIRPRASRRFDAGRVRAAGAGRVRGVRAARRSLQRRNPPHAVGHPAYQGRRLGQPRLWLRYAQAEDNLCTLADAFVTYRGERSAGSAPTRVRPPARPSASRATSMRTSSSGSSTTTPPSSVIARRSRLAAKPDRRLRGRLQPVSPRSRRRPRPQCARGLQRQAVGRADHFRRRLPAPDRRNLGGGAAQFVQQIANARPPRAPSASSNDEAAKTSAVDGDAMSVDIGKTAGIGSNALAFGAPITHDDRSLLFGNPHWFWRGPDRFYQRSSRFRAWLTWRASRFSACR